MQEIINIVTEYFKMNNGELVKDSAGEIFIVKMEYENLFYNVHITKRSLKHFTERRKEDFSKKHSENKSLEIIKLMISDLSLIINKPDKKVVHTTRENSLLIYKKTNSHATPMCLVLEIKNNKMYLVSLHFIKERDFEKMLSTK